MSEISVPTKPLAHGARIPVLGLGTYPLDDDEAARVVARAIELGYRLVDTAENYGNERGVGKGVRDSGVPREELFLTTKFNVRWHGRDLVREAFAGGVERLGVDYLDLLLIHWPNPWLDRYVGAWQGLVDLQQQGLVRAIGVSNFTVEHLERLRRETGVVPDVVQIQLNPFAPRSQDRAYHREHGIVTESWGPLGKGTELLREGVVVDIARRLGVTPAQVVLRWHLELGVVPIPKSANPDRLAENLEVFEFELSEPDLALLSALDLGGVGLADPETFGH